jgi:hypothetical protein
MPNHLKALLPPKWCGMVEAMRTEKYETSQGRVGYLASSMLMGSGHTFPLQTLLFYAITQAVCELLGERGKVSVYGDDIICPNFAAPPLVEVFRWIGFTVNTDKSFWSSDYMHLMKFRESCGGDFYDAVPVRPWMPECETRAVKKNEYIAELHKIINGLTSRWHPVELPGTLRELFRELAKVCTVSFVPDTETETSGIRCWLLHWLNVDEVLTQVGAKVNLPLTVSGVERYIALRSKVRNRLSDGRIHYWNWLTTHRASSKSNSFTERKVVSSIAGTLFRREPRRGVRVNYGWTRRRVE